MIIKQLEWMKLKMKVDDKNAIKTNREGINKH